MIFIIHAIFDQHVSPGNPHTGTAVVRMPRLALL